MHAQPLRVLEGDILAEIAEILDHRIDQRGEIDVRLRLARPAQPSQRENVVERAAHLLDRIGHLGAILIVLDRFDAHAKRRERGTQIMADRAEHAILLVEHGGDPLCQAIEGDDHVAQIAGALHGNGGGFTARGEITHRQRQGTQRPGNAARDPDDRQQDQDIDDQGLGEQCPKDAAVAARPGRVGGEPRSIGLLNGDQQRVSPSPVSPLVHRLPRFVGPDSGVDRACGNAELGQLRAQFGRDLGMTLEPGRNGIMVPPPDLAAIAGDGALRGPLQRIRDADSGGTGGLGETEIRALTQHQGKIDRLGREQGQRQEQRQLADQVTRERNPHNRVTSAASV